MKKKKMKEIIFISGIASENKIYNYILKNNQEEVIIIDLNILKNINIEEIIKNEKKIYIIGDFVRKSENRIKLFNKLNNLKYRLNIKFIILYFNMFRIKKQYNNIADGKYKEINNKLKFQDINEIEYKKYGKENIKYEIKAFYNFKEKNKYLKVLKDFIKNVNTKNLYKKYTKLKKVDKYINSMYKIEQDGINHMETVEEHVILILQLILSDYKKGKISYYEKKILLLLALYHDISKPFIKLTKKERYIGLEYKYLGKNIFEKDGKEIKIENINNIQFTSHENLSYYIFKNEYKTLLSEILNNEEFILIQSIIQEHLTFHTFNRKEELTKGKIHRLKYNNIRILHFGYSSKNLIHKIEYELYSNKPSFRGIKKNIFIDEYIHFGILFSYYDNNGRIKKEK